MIETATVIRRKIEDKIKKRMEVENKAKDGTLTVEEEIEYINDMITSKASNTEVIVEIPFRISDRADEIFTTMLYHIFRKEDSTTMSC